MIKKPKKQKSKNFFKTEPALNAKNTVETETPQKTALTEKLEESKDIESTKNTNPAEIIEEIKNTEKRLKPLEIGSLELKELCSILEGAKPEEVPNKEAIFKYMNCFSTWKESDQEYHENRWNEAVDWIKQKKASDEYRLTREGIAALLSDGKTRSEGIFELAVHCVDKFELIANQESDEILVYMNGMYNQNGHRIIAKYIQKELNLENLVTIHIMNEVMGYIKRLRYKDRESLKEPIDKVCLKNGILNLNTMTLDPHTPEIIFFNRLPVEYNAEKGCPKIKKFLAEVVPQESQDLLQELVGYCLLKDYPYQCSFMLVGTGANGKSTFINLIKNLLGPENCSSIPLQQLETNRFAASSLFGKLANLFADLQAKALKDTSFFKMLTGGDFMPAEKKFKDQFFFQNYAKLIFSCNQIPKTPDDTDAFFRRWKIVMFPHQFLGGAANKNLIKELATPDELSGFLNFAIEGLKELLEKGDFSSPMTIEEIREQYIRKSDSVAAFQMDMIEIAPEEYVGKTDLYTKYCEYCRKMVYPIVPNNTFHNSLQKLIRIEDYKRNEGGVRIPCWRGIRLKEEEGDKVNTVDPFSHF